MIIIPDKLYIMIVIPDKLYKMIIIPDKFIQNDMYPFELRCRLAYQHKGTYNAASSVFFIQK